jgi:hypothetical protein
LAVRPGRTYILTVSARSTAAGSGQGGPSASYTIAVAPPTPPTTTIPPQTTTSAPAHSTSTSATHR